MLKVLVAALFSMQQLAVEQAAPPSLGTLIDLSGRRIHLYCTGSGSPSVFIAGSYSFNWALVQPRIAQFTKVCTYDPAGTAWSDDGPSATCADRVDEIHKLFEAARIPHPVVFVGFSVGALLARDYVSLYPADVSGMVLVDHAFFPKAHQATRSSGVAESSQDRPPMLMVQTPITAGTEESSNLNNLPDSSRRLLQWAEKRRPAQDASVVARDCMAHLENMSTKTHPLGSMPLMVVSTSNNTVGYAELQRNLLRLSSRSKQIFTPKSFHSVEIDDPDAVVSAVKSIIDQLKSDDKHR